MKMFIGTCWKIDLNPHITNRAEKHIHYFRAEFRTDGIVKGSLIIRRPSGHFEEQLMADAPLPASVMQQIDLTEFLDRQSDYYHQEF